MKKSIKKGEKEKSPKESEENGGGLGKKGEFKRKKERNRKEEESVCEYVLETLR